MKRFSTLPLVFLLIACGAPVTQESIPPTIAPIVMDATIAIPTPTESAPTSPILFKIIKADGAMFEVTLGALKALPLKQITVDGKVEEGPALLDVLLLAGVSDFTEVTLIGVGAPSTLTREQVDENTILDFSNRGTMKLATTYLPKANWTKDITEILVK